MHILTGGALLIALPSYGLSALRKKRRESSCVCKDFTNLSIIAVPCAGPCLLVSYTLRWLLPAALLHMYSVCAYLY